MDKLYSIGEVSKIKGVTIKALRYYHDKGLLIPKYIDENTGYRFYSIEQFIYLDIIIGCRNLGTSIKELQEIFKASNTDKLLDFLRKKKIEAENNINKLKDVINNIDNLNKSIIDSKSMVKDNEVSLREFKERRAIVYNCKEVGELRELIYYSELDKIIRERNIRVALERGIIYDFNLDGKINPKYVFNILEDKRDIENNNIFFLPGGKYLTITYNNKNIADSISKIINYLRINNLKPKLYLEVEIFNELFNTYEYNCQIQVLVE
ncbi:helix-turn-helix domain-containing protein [Clostridium nigeriense]|uniref:MerR family transcriptional regulator n=1 Tax=Clostridium nigeriense TaxID=1805470 RepID=UPI00083397CD|nr:helix-turn-helix domain-containing protein [Clostridium nigeriense]